jgi:hypothetical protein
MELQLQHLIDRLIGVADIRNLSINNPIKFILEHPNTGHKTVVVVAHLEPYNYPLPVTVTWINVDPSSPFYKRALRRTVKIPSPGFRHTWTNLENHIDIFEPPQVHDADEDTFEDDLQAHIDRRDNPHTVTTAQIGAVNKHGDSMSGPLILSGTPSLSKEATSKEYVDGIISDLTSFLSSLQQGIATNSTKIQTNQTSISSNYTAIVSNISGIQQNLVKIQDNVNKLSLTQEALDNNTSSITDILSTIDGINNSISALEQNLNNLVLIANTTGYVHVQESLSTAWRVEHNKNSLNYTWNIWDESGSAILPDNIVSLDENNLDIIFAAPISGKAIFSFHQTAN